MDLSDRSGWQERRRGVTPCPVGSRHEDSIGHSRLGGAHGGCAPSRNGAEGDAAEPWEGSTRRVGSRGDTRGRGQGPLDLVKKDLRERRDGVGSVAKHATQSLGHGNHPLPHGHRRDDVIDRVGGGLGHVPATTGRTHAAAQVLCHGRQRSVGDQQIPKRPRSTGGHEGGGAGSATRRPCGDRCRGSPAGLQRRGRRHPRSPIRSHLNGPADSLHLGRHVHPCRSERRAGALLRGDRRCPAAARGRCPRRHRATLAAACVLDPDHQRRRPSSQPWLAARRTRPVAASASLRHEPLS